MELWSDILAIKNYENENKYIVAGFPGVGKSMAAELYPEEFIDMESSNYHWMKDENGNKICNPDWPNNYVDRIEDTFINTPVSGTILCVCCSTHTEVLKELHNRGLAFIAVMPKSREYAMDIYRDRGNAESFIRLLDNNFETFRNDLMNSDASMVIARDGYLANTMHIFAEV